VAADAPDPSASVPQKAGLATRVGHAESRALGALLVVQLLFGTLPVVAKVAFGELGASGVAFLRMAGAAAIFWIAARATGAARLPLREQPMVMLCAVLGVSGNQLLFLYGLARTSATHAALITTTIPVLTIVAAAALGRERIDARRGVGIATALAGVLILLFGKDAHGGATLTGDLMIVANASIYALYLVLSKDLLVRWSPLSVLPSLFGWGLLTALPITGLPPVGVSAAAWLSGAYIVLGPTVGTYGLNLYALRRVPASVVALFIYLQPFVASALAWPLLGEVPTPRMLLAALVTFSGVAVAVRRG
jgi:drug/metabolite transporter (DMT)-like permease